MLQLQAPPRQQAGLPPQRPAMRCVVPTAANPRLAQAALHPLCEPNVLRLCINPAIGFNNIKLLGAAESIRLRLPFEGFRIKVGATQAVVDDKQDRPSCSWSQYLQHAIE